MPGARLCGISGNRRNPDGPSGLPVPSSKWSIVLSGPSPCLSSVGAMRPVIARCRRKRRMRRKDYITNSAMGSDAFHAGIRRPGMICGGIRCGGERIIRFGDSWIGRFLSTPTAASGVEFRFAIFRGVRGETRQASIGQGRIRTFPFGMPRAPELAFSSDIPSAKAWNAFLSS